jgi:VRR-NUC domain
VTRDAAARTIPLPFPPARKPRGKRGSNPETHLQQAIEDAIIASGRAIVYRNNGGVAKYGEARVRYGLAPGSADLIGVLIPSGRFLAIEVKMPGKHLEPDQVRWRDVVLRAGGLYVTAHSVEEALDGIVF